MREKEIHIVLSSSDSFMPYCATAMASILYNISDEYFARFYILSYDITDRSKKKLSKLSNIKKCSIEYPQFDEKMLNMFEGIKTPQHVTKMTYARILIPDILPNVDKALFIDADTLIRTDIAKLYEINIDDYYFAMVEDACGTINSRNMWNDSSILYFNCGIMLVNAAKLRSASYLKLISRQIKRNKHKYTICDQDVLNDTFKHEILPLPITWNFHHEKFYNLKWYKPQNVEEYNDALKSPAILHCTGPQKPWLVSLHHKYCKEYYFYNKLTAFYRNFKHQKFAVDNVHYSNITYREKNIFLSAKSKEGKTIKLLSLTIKRPSVNSYKFIKTSDKDGIYSLKFLGIQLLRKKDTPIERSIRVLGLPIYRKKIKIETLQTSETDSLRNEIAQLKAFIEQKHQELLELSYRRSYAPLKIYNHHHKVLPKYKNKHKDKSIVICGAGPTLNQYKQKQNCIHIGLNRTFENPRLKFDYVFSWDFANLSRDDASFYDKLTNYPAQKICGLFINDQALQINEEISHRLNALTLYSSTLWGLGGNVYDPYIHYDIEHYPLMDFGSVAFGAFHFALYTGAKRIYLVGIDNSLNGYYTNTHKQRFLQVERIKEGWLSVKKFLSNYYPDVEVISINPVGLKGIFKDEYV